jgi:pimeloyl-ACP methyl ester carboxylesterase
MSELPDCFYLLLPGAELPSLPSKERQKIVLLHGWLQSHTCWLTTAVKLRDTFGHDVLLLDFYGHGRSPFLEHRRLLDIDTLVAQVKMVVDKVGWQHEKLTFGGISMGGAVLQTYMLRYPESIKRIVLVAAAGLSEHRFSLTMLNAHVCTALLNAVDSLEQNFPSAVKVLRRMPFHQFLSHANLVKDTPEYRVPQSAVIEHLGHYPLSLVWGGLDQLHTPQIEKRMDGRSDVNVLVVPWMEHVILCLCIDSLELDQRPHFWEHKPYTTIEGTNYGTKAQRQHSNAGFGAPAVGAPAGWLAHPRPCIRTPARARL